MFYLRIEQKDLKEGNWTRKLVGKDNIHAFLELITLQNKDIWTVPSYYSNTVEDLFNAIHIIRRKKKTTRSLGINSHKTKMKGPSNNKSKLGVHISYDW